LQFTNNHVQPMPDQIDQTLAHALCVELAKMQIQPGESLTQGIFGWVARCTSHPFYYLNFHRNIHVRSLNTNATKATTDVRFPYQVISNLSYNESRSTDLYTSFSASPTSLFPLSGFGDQLNFLPISVAASAGQGLSISIAESAVGQTFEGVLMQPISADLPIQRYRVCTSIEIDDRVFLNHIISERGLYLCNAEEQNLDFSELYFFSWQNTLDQEENSAQAAHFVFRGARDANTYLGMLNGFLKPLSKKPLGIYDTFANAYYVYSRMPGPLPGVISLPMVPESEIDATLNPGKLSKPNLFEQATSVLTGYMKDHSN
jgi:hypothetical protein